MTTINQTTTAGSPFSKRVVRRFAINVASLFSVHIANYLLPLLTVPFVVRIIGPERLGLLQFSQAYIAYFTLLINFGFDMAGVRKVAAHREDKALVNRIFSEILVGKALLLLVSCLIFAFISVSRADFNRYFILHLSTFISCFGTVFFPIWLYQAMEDLGRVALFQLGIKLLFTCSVFLIIRQPDDYIYYNLSLSIAHVIVSGLALFRAFRRFNLLFKFPSFQELRDRFSQDSILFYSSITITLYSSSNVFLLGLLSTPYHVGIFSAGTRLEAIARSFVGLALNQALFPIMARAFGESPEKGLKIIRTAFFPLLLVLICISLCLWFIAPYFITVFYGKQFSEAESVLRLVSILPVTIGISNLLGIHTMLNLKMDKPFFLITVFGSLIGLVLNVILIREYTHTGVAYAWVASEIFITLAMYFFLVYQRVQVIQPALLFRLYNYGKIRLTLYLTK
ncbi:flippase [Larkinella soli]|uniref:flippase n=1 Tax=Larkinella soli TaxID=1770527 RepID=UPI000FFB1CA6|nr:flippase [Larkinella soli]